MTSQNGLLDEDDIKSELSHAYLYTLAVGAGYTYQRGAQPDRSSVDAIVESGEIFKAKLDVQLKSTSLPKTYADGLHYQLGKRTYNHLRETPRSCPIILMVLELPRNREDWLDCEGEGLTMRRRAWWLSLAGYPEINTKTKTVTLPQTQLLTPDSIKDLMARAREWSPESRSL